MIVSYFKNRMSVRPHRFLLAGALLGTLTLALALTGCSKSSSGGGGTSESAWPRDPNLVYQFAPDGTGRDYVLTPEEVQYGATYSEWASRWWEWALEIPRANHPLYDPTGANAAEGQVNPVWFIGASLGSYGDPTPGLTERFVTVPGGIALFFPIINIAKDNSSCVDPDTNFSLTELRSLAANDMMGVSNLFCAIDGAVVIDSPDAFGAMTYRAQGPEFFAFIPAENVFSDLCGDPSEPDRRGPIATDGIWMMVAPMPPGNHDIQFSGSFPAGGPETEITFHITVLPVE